VRRPPLIDLATHEFPWVTPPELASYLPCDRRTILRMIAAGSLDAYQIGRHWRIPIDEARRAFHVKAHNKSPMDTQGTSQI